MASRSYFPLTLSPPPPWFDGIHSPRSRHLVPFLRLRWLSVHADASSSRPPRFVLSAARSGPPPPPPPPPRLSSDLQETLSRIQDQVRIFFAVFFWMSLFFWGSAWDGRDDGRKKGLWFRK